METTRLIRNAKSKLSEGPWQLAAGSACACVLVGLVDPTRHALTPPCPLRATTGWWCPFCGATRATSRLLRGDLPTALHFNAMFVVVLPVAVFIWAAYAMPDALGVFTRLRSHNQRILYASIAVALMFMVVRNLPPADAWLRYPGA